MLKSVLDLKEVITKFLRFYKSPTGRREFNSAKTKFDAMEEKECATIHGICHLLGSFDSATKLLSGEKYSLFVTAFPVLWKVKAKIRNDSMFTVDEADVGSSKSKQVFYGQYGNEPFSQDLVYELNSCRILLLNDFNTQFSGMDTSIMWSTLLDPKFRMNSHHWKNDVERAVVKDLLIQNVEQYAGDMANRDSISSTSKHSSSYVNKVYLNVKHWLQMPFLSQKWPKSRQNRKSWCTWPLLKPSLNPHLIPLIGGERIDPSFLMLGLLRRRG